MSGNGCSPHYYDVNSVHIEVYQNPCSTARKTQIRERVIKLLHNVKVVYGDVKFKDFDDPFLKEHVKLIAIADTETLSPDRKSVDLCSSELNIHVVILHEDGPGAEELDGEDLAAANHWMLPATEFDGLWDSLVFDENIKRRLLQYSSTTLLFADKAIDPNIITWNKVVLLHGPPGTGKTSLCKALAQKLCIRLSDRYSYGQLIEINSHSLFSKWFSESGKLVMKMFQKIQELIDDENALVCVLIDEVESLTACRKHSLSGTEPSDAIRVVNALLTQLDQIKKYQNVIILTTSNITGAIDLAFVDRADIKQYIGLPTPPAIFQIFRSCINELMRVGVVNPVQQLLDLHALEVMRFIRNEATELSLQLRDIAIKSEGCSGRSLRKLPFIAHAVFVDTATVTLEDFLNALSKAVDQQFLEMRNLCKDS